MFSGTQIVRFLSGSGLAGCLACTAAVERSDPGSGARPGAGPESTNTAPTPSLPSPGDFVGPQPGDPGASEGLVPAAPVLRRLTHDEYRATLRELLALPAEPEDTLQPDARSLGYDNFAGALTVTPTLAGQYEALAARLAAQADVASLAPCSPPSDEAACASAFIASFGLRAFRQPVSDTEAQRYLALFTQARTGGTFEEGIRAIMQGLLASPRVLYRSELGVEASATRRLLTPYEIATALSYLFTGSTPDAELLRAAGNAELSTPQQAEAQARRLLQAPRARATLGKLVSQWFGLPSLPNISKHAETFPEFTEELRASMQGESQRFIEAVLWERAGSLNELLTSASSFVNGPLSAIYQVPNPGGEAFMPTQLNIAERAGLLTHASVLSVYSKPQDSFPIARGKFVRKGLLCQSLPDPPADAMIVEPEHNPELTTRERFALHSSSPTCSSCHALIDPLGFGLENYDAIGRFRTQESGKPVDAAGMLTGTDVDGPFTGGVELGAKLAASQVAAECAVVQATRFAFGRPESATDRAVARAVINLLGATSIDIKEVLVALAKTESFFVRATEP